MDNEVGFFLCVISTFLQYNRDELNVDCGEQSIEKVIEKQ